MPDTDNTRIVKTVEVVWKKDRWYVVIHYRGGMRPKEDLNTFDNKEDAEARATDIAQWAANTSGFPVETRFKTKDGKIPKGHHGTATHGHDPEASEG